VVEHTSWPQAVFESRGFRFQIPPTFRKREFEVQYGERPPEVWQAGALDRVSAFVDSGPQDLDQAKGVRLPYHLEFTECREQIDGHGAIVQAYREEAAGSDGGGRSVRYRVYATAQIGPRVYFRVSGYAANRGGQDALLAMVRTIRFFNRLEHPSSPPPLTACNGGVRQGDADERR
jgi:hypothetical protein